jgi:hypothetical protein
MGRWQSQARAPIIARIHELWPKRQAGLMDAMLIGERGFIDRDLATLADPASLFDSSFILTFLCVLVIAGLGVPLLERTSDPFRRGLRHFQSTMFDLALPPRVVQFRLNLRIPPRALGPGSRPQPF